LKLPLRFEPTYEAAQQTFGNLYDATNKLLCCDIRQTDADEMIGMLNTAAQLAVSANSMPKHKGNRVVLAVYVESLIDAVMPCVQPAVT
jgi:hypothetical protein